MWKSRRIKLPEMSKKACVAALTERSLRTVREGEGGVWGGVLSLPVLIGPPLFFL